MEIIANKDLGFKGTFDKWNGKWFDNTSYHPYPCHSPTQDIPCPLLSHRSWRVYTD